MKLTATKIERTGKNYTLSLTGENGETLEAIIPQKLESAVVSTMQAGQALEQSKLAASFGGMLVLEVLRSVPADGRNVPGERTLAIETDELGMWALRMTRPVIEEMVEALKSLLGSDPQIRH